MQITDYDQVEKIFNLVALTAADKANMRMTQFVDELTEQTKLSSRVVKNQVFSPPSANLRVLDDMDSMEIPVLNKLVVQCPHNPVQKQKIAEIALEKCGVKRIMFADQPVLQLLSTGNTSGTVVSMGHQATTISAILDGYWLSQSAQFASTQISAAAQTHALRELLTFHFTNTAQSWWYLNTIKNMQSFETDVLKDGKATLILPDDQKIVIYEKTLNYLTDLYFEPNRFGISEVSIADQMDTVANQIPKEFQDKIDQCYLISGGMANIPGMVQQLQENSAVSCTMTINQNSHLDTYLGGQVVALCAVDQLYAKKEDLSNPDVWSTKRPETEENK